MDRCRGRLRRGRNSCQDGGVDGADSAEQCTGRASAIKQQTAFKIILFELGKCKNKCKLGFVGRKHARPDRLQMRRRQHMRRTGTYGILLRNLLHKADMFLQQRHHSRRLDSSGRQPNKDCREQLVIDARRAHLHATAE